MTEVAIFRHQLFKVSETFITQQGEALRRYSPLYVGRTRFSAPPSGACSVALEDITSQRRLLSRIWQVSMRDIHPYLHLLKGHRPSLVHAHFGVDGVYALPLAKNIGVPLVTTFHGFDATSSTSALLRSRTPSWINYVRFRNQLAREGALFLCVSKFIRQRVLELGFPADRTCLHYTGVDTEAFSPSENVMDSSTILHVARLVEVKGTEYLIRAFATVAVRFSRAKLVIVGDGPLRPALETLSNGLGLRGKVQFIGAQNHDEVRVWMRNSAFLVLPSVLTRSGNAEGLGMVLLEAAASGIPIIGTSHGGIPEIVIDGVTGFLVPERHVHALAERISILLDDKELRRRMGSKARTMVEECFDIRRQTAVLETLYDGVLA